VSGPRVDAPAPPRAAPDSIAAAAEALLLAAIAWGAFAFGAVYEWAWRPLAVAVALCGLAGLFVSAPGLSSRTRPFGIRGLTLALGAVLLGASLQLVPVPLSILDAVSPHATTLLRDIDPVFASGVLARHPLSIAPSATVTGLALASSFTLLLAGSARLFSVRGARRFATGVAMVGALLALDGIVQRPLFTGRIYGFWTPQGKGIPFGPFVNRNHFAGWMLMGLPLTLGLLCAGLAREMRGVAPHWRARVIWFSSPAANRLLLLTAAAALMALSLVLTLSRSGIAAMFAAFTLTAFAVVRHQASTRRRAVVLACLAMVFVAAVGWAGVGVVMERFAAPDWTELGDRPRAWADARDVIADFPLVGTGLNTYGGATVFYRRHAPDVHYVEAHNDYIQLAAEGGLLVGVPAACAIALLISAVRRRFADDRDASATAYWLRVGASAGLVAIALQEMLDFSLQMPGNAAMFAALCGVALHRAPARRDLLP